MSFQDDYAASQDPRVIAQVTAAIYQYAETVDTEGAVTNHAARLVLANKVVTGQQALQPLILSACAFGSLSGQTASPSSDTTVSNTVAALWNLWSGV